MKKYLLFDLDGTLTDPKIGITTCVQYALKSFGIEEPDLDKLEPFIGPPLKDSFMNFYGMDDAQAEKAIAKYRERFQDVGLFDNEIYKGVPAMLRTLQAKGMHLAVASSKPTVFVERILKHFHIEKYFEVVVGSELDGTRVNKDEVVQEALNRLFSHKEVQYDQVYMIGDRKFDVEGAKAMHVESVGVTYGYGGMEELKEAKADYIVQSVEELKEFLLRGTDDEDGIPGGQNGKPMREILTPVMTFMIFVLVRAAVKSALREFMELNANTMTVINAVSFAAAGLVILPQAAKAIKKTAKNTRLLHIRIESKWNYVCLAGATFGAVVGFNLLFFLMGIIGQSASYQEVAAQQYAGSFLLGLICYVLISPVAEELLFRGIVYGYLRQFGNVRMAIVFSAIVFGLYHGNMVQTMYGFLLGCLIAYGYEYFGTFKAAVGMHMLANLLSYTVLQSQVFSIRMVSWIVCMLSLAILVISLYVLHRKKNIL